MFSVESLALSEIAAHLDKDVLKTLRNECGGLQTLLRNNHQVFEGKDKRLFSFLVCATFLCWFKYITTNYLKSLQKLKWDAGRHLEFKLQVAQRVVRCPRERGSHLLVVSSLSAEQE